jgi:hypothetical protein
MNRVRQQVVVIAAAAMMGSAQAAETVNNLGTLTRTVAPSSAATPFSTIFNFTVAAGQRTVVASAASYTPERSSAGYVTDLTLTLYAGSDATGAQLATVPSQSGATSDLSHTYATGRYSARVSGLTAGQLGGGFQFSVAADPEPSGWVTLLCGLVVVAFIARRKSNLVTV